MSPQELPPQGQGLDLGDIYYVFFRHKWKILICSILGIAVAAALFRFDTPLYQSEAKLLVRYILSESKMTGPNADNAPAKIMPDERGASVMTTEVEILTSADLARDVATSVGPERLLAKAGGGKDLGEAVKLIRRNLVASVAPRSSVLQIVFKHPDLELVQPVLREVIDRYLKLHVETHRAAGLIGDSLAQEADTLRSRLNTTEDELRNALNKSGVISVEHAKEEFATRMIAIRREISNYEAELAGRIAVYESIRKKQPATSAAVADKPSSEPEATIPASVLDELQTVAARVNRLTAIEQELLVQFTPESTRVKEAKAARVEAEAALNKLREQYPALTKVRTPTANPTAPDPEATEAATAWLQITSYQAKIKELNAQLERLKADAAKLDLAEGNILELRRKKEIEEANYRYYAANLEQARISQTLGNGKVSNITQIQSPSSPYRTPTNFKKIGLPAAGGIVLGLLWAFVIEFYLDRSVRRPIDLQRKLRVPLLLSIPRLPPKELTASMNGNGYHALANGKNGDDGASNTELALPMSKRNHHEPLQLFHETLRDRLISYFESKNLTHKPKLVAVTGLLDEAGVTTTAAGLARSLSETGEGNVLLVDMTAGQGAAQQFVKGKAVCDLDALLEARSHAHVHENLYVVSESNGSDRLSRSLPKRFARIIPKLKASDFDYILFDMPTISQLSITPRLATFMDMVLLVVESEKTDRDLVQGACDLLADSKVHVGVILNKTRNYVPSRLHQELIGGSI